MGQAQTCSTWRRLSDRGSIFYPAADFLEGTKDIIYPHFRNRNNLFLLVFSSTVSCWRQLYGAQYSRVSVSSPIRIKTSALLSVVSSGLVWHAQTLKISNKFSKVQGSVLHWQCIWFKTYYRQINSYYKVYVISTCISIYIHTELFFKASLLHFFFKCYCLSCATLSPEPGILKQGNYDQRYKYILAYHWLTTWASFSCFITLTESLNIFLFVRQHPT